MAEWSDEYEIVCDGSSYMDGSRERQVLGRFTTLAAVQAQMPGVIARSKHSPRRNLRIEHRRVTGWTVTEEYGDV